MDKPIYISYSKLGKRGEHLNIYLVRHGQTEDNEKKVYYGKKDSSLNLKGKEQAKQVGQQLRDIRFSKVFLSESKRTKETVKLILENKEANYIIDKRINEMDMGIFEGRDYKQLEELYPEQWKGWCENWIDYTPPKGENFSSFYKRIESFINDIKALKDENILIVTHGGVIKSFYTYVMGGHPEMFWKFATRNGDISLIKYEYGNMFIDYIKPLKLK